MVRTCVVHLQGLKMGTPSDKSTEALEIKLSKRTVPCAHSIFALVSFIFLKGKGLAHYLRIDAKPDTHCFFGGIRQSDTLKAELRVVADIKPGEV